MPILASGSGQAGEFGKSVSSFITTTIDTTSASETVFCGSLANSADTLSLEMYLVELILP